MELSELRGVGKARLEALHAAGIFSLRELLSAAPYRYKDLSRTATVSDAPVGARVCVALRREGAARIAYHGGRSRVWCEFTDDTGRLTAWWFNQPWMKDNLNKLTSVTLFGTVEAYGGKKRLTNPTIEKELRILPVYRPIEGLPQRTHEAIVMQALNDAPDELAENMPARLVERYGLMPRDEAIRTLHAPESMERLYMAQRRFSFEQALLYQASVRLVRGSAGRGTPIVCPRGGTDAFWATMPFAPTGAQRRTLDEIITDMSRDTAMARMVQGDVGSGKTAVAMGAMLICAKAGYQAALMAPTEILARQHYGLMREYYERLDIGCGLLVGGMPAKERREALAHIKSGEWKVVIGTHALISKSVVYNKLALCVTDEQHRFGVAQRTALMRKAGEADAPHLLVMSATPIPRSLALVLFGDLGISVIDELPPGRKPVSTRIVPESKRESMYSFLMKELDTGRQAYIVCPLVEQSESEEKLTAVKPHMEELKKGALSRARLGMAYGSQPAEEKQKALADFASGDIQALVASTVIEVGVNVPNATVMIIEDADRYGLAQLHQLRGRVGRGADESWCFLMASPNERLRALTATSDGFEIARADMEQRGFGELLGTRQHGAALLPSGAAGDVKILYEATQCAEELCTDPSLAGEWETIRREAEALITRVSDRVSVS